MPKAYWFLRKNTTLNAASAVEVGVNIAPIPNPKNRGIFLKIVVATIRKVPIFADPIQKRIPQSINYHGKSL
jgi:hypothetical protein